MHPTTQDFIAVILIMLNTAQDYNQQYLDITAGNLHAFIGGYPNPNHRMRSCNSAMRQVMQENDLILEQPPQGHGATLTIRYFMPRLNA